jgi:hypothetical protein
MAVTPFVALLWKVKLEVRNRAPEVSLRNPLYSSENFIFQQDNAPVYVAHTKDSFERKEIPS